MAAEHLPHAKGVAQRPLSNAMLAIAGLLFLVLCVKQIWDQPWSEFF